jgi:NAD(P)-dependent dehydrogenase (short-subunit alcohol dehydrogenase family)
MSPRATPSLSGRHALVTGAGGGIGAAVTVALAREGARVSLFGRNRKSLEAAAEQLPGGEQTIVPGDVTSRSSVASAFKAAREAFGPVDILVNNAGQAASAPLHKADDALWDRMLAVNLTGSYYCIREALPDMLASGFGRIVNVASIAGLTGAPYITAYCASKHGVVGLTRALAREVATRNITVNAVCPGYTDTELVRQAIGNIRAKTGITEEKALAELIATNPQKRLIQPDEVAHMVLWLCLPGTESVTGQSLAIAGGGVL